MFTQTLTSSLGERLRGSRLLGVLTGPHGVDRYTELLDPTLVLGDARAKVVAVRRTTPRSVTLTLAPNAAFTERQSLRAGQHVNLTVEIDGRRHTRCYSPANAEGAGELELTIGRHDGGLVSTHLYEHARAGMVVGLDGAAGEFVLPAARPRNLLFVAGGSGITPVMAMLRTLHAEGFDGTVTLLHYVRNAADACYRDELAAMPGVRVLYGYTRSGAGDVAGHFGPDHLAAARGEHDDDPVVYVCGPSALADAVRAHCATVYSESFTPPEFVIPTEPSGGRVSFTASDVGIVDDGRNLLDQAEAAGLSPRHGCRMGICHTCTCRKTSGVVMNLTTGAVSSADAENIQICVSVPVGDVQIDL
ncbi:ferredoxin reductase [Mycolicibacillus trivialis]